jgi:hypothetical protein
MELSEAERKFFTSFKKRLADEIHEQAKGVVQAGPFKGMKLINEGAWEVSAMAPMILGSYEKELQPIFEAEIERLEKLAHPIIVNIGCAEGYYAIGLGRRLPKAIIYALDTNDESLAIMKENAKLNDVTNIVVGADLGYVLNNPTFIVSDCEGSETAYLDPLKWRGTVGSTVLCEIHDTKETADSEVTWTDKILYERYRESHYMQLVLEGGRNPYDYELIRTRSSEERFLALSEGRPYLMVWCYMRPRGYALS